MRPAEFLRQSDALDATIRQSLPWIVKETNALARCSPCRKSRGKMRAIRRRLYREIADLVSLSKARLEAMRNICGLECARVVQVEADLMVFRSLRLKVGGMMRPRRRGKGGAV